MDITSDLAAVSQRIAQITGTGVPDAGPATGQPFGAMVQAALDQPAPISSAPAAPAEIDRLIDSNSAAWNVDPALVKAIVANESGFDSQATSSAGAQGLMQLMPETAAGLGVTDAYDPAQNVWGGTRYIRGLLDRFGGNVPLAVAAYNAGPGAVEKYGGVPPYAETQNYVQNVLASYDKYRMQTPR
ncbi:MAG TPA: lytic transglycosylase domain-containing protein [Candidatus Acidoferrales bacterium]|nr:lytic transglycosylase domain-containing protein [Candidatus Acidoferrales bacterium]